MPVVALRPDYEDHVPIRDRVENFHGNQVVYLHWERHLSYCAALAFPLPPDMPFGALIDNVLCGHYNAHPDFKSIDWSKVRWDIDGKEVTVDPGKSLKDHGVGHKSLIRFTTPGLEGFKGSAG